MSIKDVTEERWATLAEIADHLQVRQETVHCWIRSKSLPGHRLLGRNWRFKRSEVDLWVRQPARQESAR